MSEYIKPERDGKPTGDGRDSLPSRTLPASVLVVDDDEHLRDGYRRLLTKAGFGTLALPSAEAALARLRNGEPFDVIVSDIVMPGTDGIALLRQVREHDLDIPVILVTGNPSLMSAVETVRYGGFRYLIKPASPSTLIASVREAIQLHRLARLKRESLTLLSFECEQLGDRASLETHFRIALERLWIAFQPIVSWRSGGIVAYEALVRCAECRLGNPTLLFDAAERLGRVQELGRIIRRLVAQRISQAPLGTWIFVNVHPMDFQDPDLASPDGHLTPYAHRVVLDVTERRTLDLVQDIGERAIQLRDLGYRISVDDLGVGYAGLASFTVLEPDFVKLDAALIRDINASKRKQSLVQSLISICGRELGMLVICEGVETEVERDVLESLGADLMQGYLFGRPVDEFAQVALAPKDTQD